MNEVSTTLARVPIEVSSTGPVPLVPKTFDEFYRVAEMIFKSGMAPRGMENAASIMMALIHGAEIGLLPMQSIQSIAVINGRPGIYGDAAIALCEPYLDDIEETYEGVPFTDDFKAVCTVKRKGKARTTREEFSVGDAKQAELWAKKGPKGPTPWVTYPKRMLKMRARGFALRDRFADVLKGLRLAEEIADIPADDEPGTPRQIEPGVIPPTPPPPPPPKEEETVEVEVIEEPPAPPPPPPPPSNDRPRDYLTEILAAQSQAHLTIIATAANGDRDLSNDVLRTIQTALRLRRLAIQVGLAEAQKAAATEKAPITPGVGFDPADGVEKILETTTFVDWIDKELGRCEDAGALDIRWAELDRWVSLADEEQRNIIANVFDAHDQRLNTPD